MNGLSEFHLGDHLRFKSGGLLVSLESSQEDIINRQKRVISILEKYSGIRVVETDEGPGIDVSNSGEHKINRIMKLLEENSILQDALHYLSSEICSHWKSISDITKAITLLKIQIMSNQSEKVDIYNFVDIAIGEIITDLKNDIHGGSFKPSEEEIREIEELESARNSFLSFLNSPGGSVMIG